MSYSEVYIPGDRLVECEICGFEWRFSQMRKGVSGKQIGFIVGPNCFDPIHPNENFILTPKAEGILEKVK